MKSLPGLDRLDITYGNQTRMQLFVVMADSAYADLAREDWLRVKARWDVDVSDSSAVLSDQDKKLVTIDLLSGRLLEANSFVGARSPANACGCLQLTS